MEPDTDSVRCKIGMSGDIAEYMRLYHYKGDDIVIQEFFYIVLLNNSNNTIGTHRISQGTITAAIVDIRLIAKYALESLATSVILVHNHPSGNLRPSKADEMLTKKIKEGLGLLDIKVLDHIILTEESHFSFADDGIL